MKLGTAKIVITPEKPIRLCGYATRTKAFEKIEEDIYVRVHIQEQDEKRFLYIYADLLWWNSEFVLAFRKILAERTGVKEDNIYFVASHNHSGPATGDNFTELLETFDYVYAEWLKKKILKAVEIAESNMEEVCIKLCTGNIKLNVFRRKKDAEGNYAMLPNYEVTADDSLTVLGFYKVDGTLKGSLIHYPCHANISDKNTVHPDYPGVVLRMLDEKYFGSVSMFLQGCTADLRPNCVLGNRFIAGDYEKVKIFAGYLFDAVTAELEKNNKYLDTTNLIIKNSRIRFDLPLKQDFDREKVEDCLSNNKIEVSQWAKKVLQKNLRPYEEMELSYIEYGDIFSIIFFNAEVSQYYSTYSKNIKKNCICAGYVNGMIGYIATAEEIAQGGYEPCGSALYFALAGTYKQEIEEIIHSKIEKIIENV